MSSRRGDPRAPSVAPYNLSLLCLFSVNILVLRIVFEH